MGTLKGVETPCLKAEAVVIQQEAVMSKLQQPQPQATNSVLARIMAAATVLFQPKEPATRGLEVSDSIWEAWEEAMYQDRQERVSVRN